MYGTRITTNFLDTHYYPPATCFEGTSQIRSLLGDARLHRTPIVFRIRTRFPLCWTCKALGVHVLLVSLSHSRLSWCYISIQSCHLLDVNTDHRFWTCQVRSLPCLLIHFQSPCESHLNSRFRSNIENVIKAAGALQCHPIYSNILP